MTIRLLDADDASAYKVLRVQALREHPEAFGQSPEMVEAQPLDEIAAQLVSNATFGAFDDVDALIGMITIGRNPRPKVRHRAWIAGMYVVAEAQGKGWGRRLLDAALQHARHELGGTEDVVLAVTVGNAAAETLYRNAGFVQWGVDPRYLKLSDGTYYDIAWMILSLQDTT